MTVLQSDRVEPVDPRAIHCPPQVRTVRGDLPFEELKASIKAVGILQPVLLRRVEGKLLHLEGARRILAAIELGLAAVPAIVIEGELDDAGVIQRQLITNCIREELSPLDQANAIHNLMIASGRNATEVAQLTGKSAGTVSKLLTLLAGSDEVKAKLAAGEIGLKAAYDTIRSEVARRPAPPLCQPQRPTPKSKLTATLDSARSITVHGVDSTIDAFISVLEELLSRTKAAKKQGIELPTLLAMFKDQARA